jgi:hypothetical protein
MSLLPGQILPQSTPIGKANADGTITIDKNWWLFLYNLAKNTLSTGTGTAAISNTEEILLNEIDARVSDTIGGSSPPPPPSSGDLTLAWLAQ